MPLINEFLTVWDISYRWAGYDPDKYYLRHHLAVKDNFKLLMGAIIHGELYCETLVLPKRPNESKSDPNYYIRTHLDDVYACISGARYNKKLLKWAVISRDDFKEWCECRSIPLPEFWFPPGWNYEFEEPDLGTRAIWAQHMEPAEPGGFAVRFEIPEEAKDNYSINNQEVMDEEISEDELSLRANQLAKLLVQKMAINIWAKHKDENINPSQMARHEFIQNYTDASHYQVDTIRGWVKDVAPKEVKGRRGRPPKKAYEDDD